MNTGAFGEGFPYTNFHDLNMDWIIKIAKDFLDQYTHIQQIIADGETSLQQIITDGETSLQTTTTEGLQQLQEKADNLEELLQAWYNEHSEDIANQLAVALSDLNDWYTTHEGYLDQYVSDSIAEFNQAAEEKGEEVIDSIPDDYSALSENVNKLNKTIGLNLPDNILTFTYNPNPDHEGDAYPAGTFGIGSANWDVSACAGKIIAIIGDELGWCMVFTDTISPANFYSKTNAFKKNFQFIKLPSNAKYLTANEYVDTSKLYIIDANYLERDFLPNSYNVLIRDSMTWTVSASNTTNFYADIYLEQGKTYNISRLGQQLASTLIEITTGEGTQLLLIQDFGSLGNQKTFTWNNNTGWWKYHHITGPVGYVNPETIANDIIVWESAYGNWNEIAYTKGIANYTAMWTENANNSLKLGGKTTKELINIAHYTDSVDITCIGDSLMQGVGAPAYNIVNQLNYTYLAGSGRTAFRYAVGGDSSWRIACRVGASGVSIMPLIIPGDTTPVEAHFIDSEYADVIFGALNGLLFGVESVWIGGIECRITVNEAHTTNYIARKEVGSQIVITRPTIIWTEIMQNHRDDTFVIWAGTNDGLTANNVETTFANIDNIINIMNSDRYIVMGMTSKASMPDIDLINEKFASKYGSKFLNIRQYLIRYGMEDNSLTNPTYTLDDQIPDQLLYDATHFNRYGYNSCAKAIYNMIMDYKY